MMDALGTLLIELRDDTAVDNIVDGRVRGQEPAPGDAMGPGQYKAFVVISTLATPRLLRVPVQRATYSVRCYGRTPQEAMSLYAACSDAIHLIGPRLRASNGLGIYTSLDTTGGTASKDPDTQQPLVDFVIELLATTQAVTA